MSGVYNSFYDDAFRGNINCGSDTFYAMLLAGTYSFDKDAHSKRSSLTSHEIAASGGYVAGGFEVAATVTKDNATDKTTIEFAGLSIPDATISAHGIAYYKRRGGADTADELVLYVEYVDDEGSPAPVTSTAGTWSSGPCKIEISNVDPV